MKEHRITIRLSDSDLAELDGLLVLYSTRGPHTRADVVRSLIRSEHKANRERITKIRKLKGRRS